MGKKLRIGSGYGDTLTAALGNLKKISIHGNTAVYHTLSDLWAQRTFMTVDMDASLSLPSIIPSNQMVWDFSTDIMIPSVPRNEDLSPKPHVYRINPQYNYRANHYLNHIVGFPEEEIMTPYLQMENIFNKNLPDYQSLRSLPFPISQEKIINFESYQASYNPTKFKHAIFDHEHTFNNNADAEKYPIYNEVYFSYPKENILFPSLGGTSSSNTKNLFERIMLMFGHHMNSLTSNATTYSGYRQILLSNVKDKYYDQYNDNEIIFLSEDYHSLNPTDWSHMVHLEEVIQELSKKSVWRNYEDIWNGKLCKNEFLFFKIEKWAGEMMTGDPIQTFLIPASKDYVSFIDTQLKNGLDYTYSVTGYCAIYGSGTQFHDITSHNLNSGGSSVPPLNRVNFMIDVSPAIMIIEVPMFNETSRLVPIAPMPPIVSFHNESNSPKKVKIYLELNKGLEESEFISISDTDIEQYYNIPPLANGFRRFGYTKEPASFQIFKMETRPTSYEDFEGHMINSFTNNNLTPSMMVHDQILPHKKYYYTFRTVGTSLSVSNPSPIYEVEMFQTADKSILKVNTVIFETEEEKERDLYDSSKNFRNLIQIMPSGDQVELEEFFEENGGTPREIDLRNVVIGKANKNIWGRKMKIRIRSNDSGKAIDFNIKFNLIKENSEEDFSR